MKTVPEVEKQEALIFIGCVFIEIINELEASKHFYREIIQ